MQDRTTACRNGMNEHHRCAHPYAGNFGFERAFILALEMGHIGRGAAHIEADQAIETGLPSGFRHSNNSARGPG
jgi:hypothetical protein